MLAARGRHDPCVLPRAVPMVEAMAALGPLRSRFAPEGDREKLAL